VITNKKSPIYGKSRAQRLEVEWEYLYIGILFDFKIVQDIDKYKQMSVTYDHRLQRIGDPVRSPLHKLQIGRLVVEWVTISEYLLLYVFTFCWGGFFGTYPERKTIE
jgi:hypothetical protein